MKSPALALACAVMFSACGGSDDDGSSTGDSMPPAQQAPTITQQPANQAADVGATATFTVGASGTPTPTYQWQKGGAAISGATSESYTTPALTAADNGQTFAVVVTNSAGAITSS